VVVKEEVKGKMLSCESDQINHKKIS